MINNNEIEFIINRDNEIRLFFTAFNHDKCIINHTETFFCVESFYDFLTNWISENRVSSFSIVRVYLGLSGNGQG